MSKKSPQLRFEGFTDDWEQRKLLDLLSQPITDGPHETPDLVDKGVPFISVDAIVDNKIDFHRKRGFITEEYDLECRKKYAPQRDDVYLVKSGSTVGKVAIVETDTRFNIWSPLAAMRANRDLLLPKYLYHFLQLKDTQQEVFAKSKGGTQPNLSMRILEKFNVRLPGMDEQKKISDCLDNLDHLITLHQRKLDLLKEQKKGYLQKMFPKNGEKVPELRFAGFADDWEERKLQEVLRERNIQQPQSMEYPLVSFTVENGVTPKTDRYEREQLVVGDKSSKKYKVTVLNDIVYNPANLKFGAISRNKYGNAVFSPIYITFVVNNDVTTPEFIEMFVTRNDFIKRALKYQQGTVYERQSVSPTDLLSMNVYLPGKSEQEKIGSFFQQLDDTIVLHQRKLDLLKEQKKGFLQKMFV